MRESTIARKHFQPTPPTAAFILRYEVENANTTIYDSLPMMQRTAPNTSTPYNIYTSKSIHSRASLPYVLPPVLCVPCRMSHWRIATASFVVTKVQENRLPCIGENLHCANMTVKRGEGTPQALLTGAVHLPPLLLFSPLII